MRIKLALAVAAAVAVAGCSRRGEVSVVYKGGTPCNAKVEDTRCVEFRCPACGKSVNAGDAKCPDRKCAAKITWNKDRDCAYCNATGACKACQLMNQTDGNCYNCRGKGNLIMLGKAPDCPNCAKGQKGKCPTCKGSQKCDFCEGNGTVSLDKLKGRTAPAGKPESE